MVYNLVVLIVVLVCNTYSSRCSVVVVFVVAIFSW